MLAINNFSKDIYRFHELTHSMTLLGQSKVSSRLLWSRRDEYCTSLRSNSDLNLERKSLRLKSNKISNILRRVLNKITVSYKFQRF